MKKLIVCMLLITSLFTLSSCAKMNNLQYDTKIDTTKGYLYGNFQMEGYDTSDKIGINIQSTVNNKIYKISFFRNNTIQCIEVDPGEYRVISYFHANAVNEILNEYKIEWKVFKVERNCGVYVGDFSAIFQQRSDKKFIYFNVAFKDIIDNYKKTTELFRAKFHQLNVERTETIFKS